LIFCDRGGSLDYGHIKELALAKNSLYVTKYFTIAPRMLDVGILTFQYFTKIMAPLESVRFPFLDSEELHNHFMGGYQLARLRIIASVSTRVSEIWI
jgi:hypothetical protein